MCSTFAAVSPSIAETLAMSLSGPACWKIRASSSRFAWSFPRSSVSVADISWVLSLACEVRGARDLAHGGEGRLELGSHAVRVRGREHPVEGVGGRAKCCRARGERFALGLRESALLHLGK